MINKFNDWANAHPRAAQFITQVAAGVMITLAVSLIIGGAGKTVEKISESWDQKYNSGQN